MTVAGMWTYDTLFSCVDGIVLREVGHLAQAHPVSALVVGWVGGVVLLHGGRGAPPSGC